MIDPASTCDYEATLEEIRDSDTVWAGREFRAEGERLAGRQPRICVDRQRISLTDVSRFGAVRGQIVIPAGDAILRVAEPGDLLCVTRTGQAAWGVSLLRNEELVVAFGAVAHVPLGSGVRVERMPDDAWASDAIGETWLEFDAGGSVVKAHAGDTLQCGQYDIYVERSWQPSPDGPDEQASIALRSVEGLPFWSVRSAIIMANSGFTQRKFGGDEEEASSFSRAVRSRFGLGALLRRH